MNGGRLSRLVVQTPEGCSFSLPLAGPICRFLAWLVDLVCVMAATIAVSTALNLLFLLSPGLATGLGFLIVFVIWFGYGLLLEWFWRGRTVGKRILRLRVIDEQGLRLTFSQVAIRNLLRLVDMLPLLYLVGGLACLLSRRSQRLGDVAAGTVVVRTPRLAPPDLSRVLAKGFASFRAYPHLAARLRQRATPAEARLALQAVQRRDLLYPEARLKLFRELAEHFRSVVEFPQQAVEGLSDENYVRNVVDALFRPQVKTGLPGAERANRPAADSAVKGR